MNDVLTDNLVDQTTPDITASRRSLSRKGKIAAAIATVALLAGGGVAMTQLGSSTTTSSQSGPGALGAGQGAPPGGGAPASGTISAVSATSVGVKSASGAVTTYTVSSATIVANNGAASTVAKLTVGEKVVVFTGGAPGSASTTATDNSANRIMAGTSATQGPGAGASGGTPPNGTAPGPAA
jgi:hypothetical protein